METINDVIKEQETAEQETANQVTENRKGRKKKTKCVNNFGRIGWILVLGLVLEVIVSSIVLYIVQRKNPALLEDANLSTIVSYIMLIVSIYLPTIFLGRKLEKREIQKNKMPFGMLMVSIIVIYSAGILSNIVGTIINYVLGIATGEGIQIPLLDALDGLNPFLIIVLTAVVAPVFEELVFRKIIIDSVIKYNEISAIIFSGLCFGLFHGNLSQFVYTFVVGMLFAYIYVRTGKIKYTICCHVVLNTLGSVPIFLMQKIDLEKITEYVQAGEMDQYMEYVIEHVATFALVGLYGMIVLTLIVLGIIFLFVFRKKFFIKHREDEIKTSSAVKLMFLNPGMIIFLVIEIMNIVAAQFGDRLMRMLEQ